MLNQTTYATLIQNRDIDNPIVDISFPEEGLSIGATMKEAARQLSCPDVVTALGIDLNNVQLAVFMCNEDGEQETIFTPIVADGCIRWMSDEY